MQTLREQSRAVRAGEVSPVELVERALASIERTQPRLNAFTSVFADDAIARAKELEGAEPEGPLHGVPIAVKDLFDVAGAETSGCSAPYRGRIAQRDAAVVERLREAGAIIVGKTNQHELAVGATNRISCFGPVWNPWGEGLMPGGSSGGSAAAVAAGVVAAAMGSDTGGSIRIPSSFCGVTGLKPTHGAVSLRGAMPLAPLLDTAGPIARTAEDCATVYRLTRGFDPSHAGSRRGEPIPPPADVRSLRIGVPRNLFTLVDAQTRRAIEQCIAKFESIGVRCVECAGPDLDDAWAAVGPMMFGEFVHYYRDLWDDERPDPEIVAFISYGRSLSAADLAQALESTTRVRHGFAVAFDQADALIAPGTPFPAPKMDASEVEVEGGSLNVNIGGPARMTLPVNLAGLPAMAFPVGMSSGGLPLGAQLIGRCWAEEEIIALVAAYQSESDWHHRRPPGA